MSEEIRKLRNLRLKKSVKGEVIVKTVQELYPKFDKFTLSKCENGDVYGVDLRLDAKKLLRERFAAELDENGSLSNSKSRGYQIRCRIPKAERDKLQLALNANHTTIQAWMSEIIRNYIDRGGKPMTDIPNHPAICNTERTGYPSGQELGYPVCPVCGAECETVYKSRYGAYVGCDVCMEARDAWSVDDCFPERN
ncbi:MAG: hypothetical protein J6J62_05870 [Oscillospiraceae bacterium]|nr:hypothetical protein [Oscillospiraceae bacterium]